MLNKDIFLNEFRQFLEFLYRISWDRDSDVESFIGFMDEIISESSKTTNDLNESTYLYLSAFLTVDYILTHYAHLDSEPKLQQLLERAYKNITFCVEVFPSVSEYQIMSDAIASLLHRDKLGQIALGVKTYVPEEYERFIFPFDLVNALYEKSRHHPIAMLYNMTEDVELESLLQRMLPFSDPTLVLSACAGLYDIYYNSEAEASEISTEAGSYLLKGYNTLSFELAESERVYLWFEFAEEYAEALVWGLLSTEPKDFKRGHALLQRISKLDFPCNAKDLALRALEEIEELNEG